LATIITRLFFNRHRYSENLSAPTLKVLELAELARGIGLFVGAGLLNVFCIWNNPIIDNKMVTAPKSNTLLFRNGRKNILWYAVFNAMGIVNLNFMNRWERLMAFRLLRAGSQSFSKNMMILAISAVALSVSVMIITVSSVKGFQNGIKSKVVKLHGDFIIDDAGNTESAEPRPFSNHLPTGKNLDEVLSSIKGVTAVQMINSKACIMKSENELDGVVANGMNSEEFLRSFKDFMVEIAAENTQDSISEIVTDSSNAGIKKTGKWIYISRLQAEKLKVKIGEWLTLVFFESDENYGAKPRPKRLQIKGIFETGIDFVDENSVYVANDLIAPFLPTGTKYTKIEIWTDPSQTLEVGKELAQSVIPAGYLRLNTSSQYHRQIYDWLSILNTNVWIIIILMAVVAVIAVITILLILIFEKISVIGLLQAMGGKIISIQKVFLWQGSFILLWGILLGDILGLGLVFVQNQFKIIELNQSIYFLKTVELQISWYAVILIDLGLLILAMVSGLLPIQWIKKMAPIRAIRYQ